jgi:hypothetical protein
LFEQIKTLKVENPKNQAIKNKSDTHEELSRLRDRNQTLLTHQEAKE